MKIYGYGAIDKLDLSTEKIVEMLSNTGLGKFTIRLEMSENGQHGGIIMNELGGGNSLEGAMFEFEKGYFIAWSCGEYIDTAIFMKK